MRSTKLMRLAAIVATLAASAASWAQSKDDGPATYTDPPELTTVTGTLVHSDKSPAKGGVIYLIFQNRLIEIPKDNSLERVKAIAEKSAAVTEEGGFNLLAAPGNYALIYDPAGDPASLSGPGPESMAVAKKLTREQIDSRIATIKDNAANGYAMAYGKMGDAFVVENRVVRPPQVEFADTKLESESRVVVLAQDEGGQPIDFPATLRLRGKNGDVYEPHAPSTSEPGKYVFHDVFPQDYQVFAIGSKPKPGAGDEITTPTIKNDRFVFDGTAVEQKITVAPGKPGEGAAPPAPKMSSN